MGLPPGAELPILVASVVVLSLLVTVVYRRLLFGMLSDPDERSPEAEPSVDPGERHCPTCGASNDAGFEKWYECASRLQNDPVGDDSQ